MRADLAQRHGDDVGGEGDRLGMEIAARDGRPHRGNRIGLSVTASASISSVRAALASRSSDGAHHLRLAAEAVGILHPAAAVVAGEDLAAVEQVAQLARRRAIWPGWPRSCVRCAGRTACAAALERVDRQGAGDEARRRTPARRGTGRRARSRSRPACR